MKSARPRSVDNIVFNRDLRTSFIQVDTPTSKVPRLNIVDEISANDRARLNAQCIDAAIIVDQGIYTIRPFPKVMDVIKFNLIIGGGAFGTPPCPTDGDARIVKVMNMIVRDPVIGRISNPNGSRAME